LLADKRGTKQAPPRGLHTAAILLGSLALAMGCEGSAPRLAADGGGADAPSGGEDFIDRLARAACVAISRCGEADLVETRSFAGTGERCVQRMRPRLAVGYRTELALVQAGRARIDGDRLDRCLQTIASTCTRVATLVSGGVCSRLFAGTAADGAACSDILECANDGWCEVPAGAGDGCGRCRPGKPLGARCTLDLECSRAGAPAGVLCAASAGFRCTALEIAPEAAAGENCGLVSSAALVSVGPCGPALWCDVTDDSRTGVCRDLVQPGAPCEQGRSVCQDGHICPESVSTCQPLEIADLPGQACNDVTGSTICNHYEGLFCEAGTCQSLSRPGEACADDTSCAFGLSCDHSSHLCQSPRPDGAACLNDADCTNERCAATPIAPGAAVTTGGVCQARVCL
jgi:hypothetical protein